MAAGTTVSPLAIAALDLVDGGVTIPGLERRFADRGAGLANGVADRLLTELAELGLVRVARGAGATREYVATSLGNQARERGLLSDAAALEELERLRTDLLSTIAHELRTPLTAIRTSVGLLLDPATKPSAGQRRRMLETIDRNADRMQRLVGDILDLARFRSGAVRLQLRRFDAAKLAESVVATIGPLAERRGQRLSLDAPPGPAATVYGDRRRLEQALLNLASNAQRFAPDGGRVEVGLVVDGGQTRWSVADDGPGIAEADQARLFERFFVGRGDRHEIQEGVGLGLPTALAIAQAHGGTIEVRSRPGAGSTFTLVVPTDGPPDTPGETA